MEMKPGKAFTQLKYNSGFQAFSPSNLNFKLGKTARSPEHE